VDMDLRSVRSVSMVVVVAHMRFPTFVRRKTYNL